MSNDFIGRLQRVIQRCSYNHSSQSKLKKKKTNHFPYFSYVYIVERFENKRNQEVITVLCRGVIY